MIFTNSDGGARGNPGPGAIGIIVRDEGKILTTYGEKIGRFATNNEAEYKALIKALELAKQFGKEVTCFVDSELVHKQLLGMYAVKNARLMPLFLEVQKQLDHFDHVKFQHVRRDDQFQQLADALVNQELDKGYD